MRIKICIAGATGWVGSELTREINNSKHFRLVSVVGKKHVNHDLGKVLSIPSLKLRICSSINEAAKAKPDVLIDYTHPSIVKNNVIAAIKNKLHVIIGTSGLTSVDLNEINEYALKSGVGVIACGNYSLTAMLLQKFAVFAAKYIRNWEIIDYAHENKPDSPSSTCRELANKLIDIGAPLIEYPIEKTIGQKEARGASVNGTQIHSVRLPGYVFAFDTIFGLKHEKLILRHEADTSAEPYVQGTLLAAKEVIKIKGLVQGFDSILNSKK